jgi:uncharacterized protein (TIGR02217 family)
MMTSVPSRWVVTETDLTTSADVFPALPGQGFVEKAPTFSTLTRTASSGRESRTARWAAPRWAFKVSYEAIRNRVGLPELTRIWGFFCTALGSYGAWFFHDAFDDTVTTTGVLGTGDGSSTDFQASRTLAAGTAFQFQDPVYCFWLQPTVYVNGVATTAFTVQPWGVIRFTTAPANGAVLTWSGQFLFVCRFDQDDLNVKQMTHDLFSQDGIKFLSLKP